MDYEPDERYSDEEYAEAYREWFWHHEAEQQSEALEAKLEAADMHRKEIKESQ